MIRRPPGSKRLYTLLPYTTLFRSWWQGFPYWTTAAITGTGGILGVLFSVPLRRALVVDTPLPYPEGRAAAEVLRVGSGSREGDEESSKGLTILIWKDRKSTRLNSSH